MYLYLAEKEKITGNSLDNCSSSCLMRGWCKSFDYNNNYGNSLYKNCYLYDKSVNEGPELSTRQGKKVSHYDKIVAIIESEEEEIEIV